LAQASSSIYQGESAQILEGTLMADTLRKVQPGDPLAIPAGFLSQ
jgi:hypothetical protein